MLYIISQNAWGVLKIYNIIYEMDCILITFLKPSKHLQHRLFVSFNQCLYYLLVEASESVMFVIA